MDLEPKDTERTTSAAKEIDPLEADRLGSTPEIGENFDQASGKDGLGPPMKLSELEDGSQQVKDTGSRLDMRPPEEMAREPDRQAHTNAMERDDVRAKYERIFEEAQQTPDYGAGLEGPPLDQSTGFDQELSL